MKGPGDKLIGDAERFPFEERIFNFAMLLGIFMTFFGTMMDVYYRVDIRIDLLFEGCWILTYYLSRFRRYFNVVSVVSSAIFVFAFIPYSWIFSGGSRGILPYYTIAFIVIISIILKGHLRMVMVLSMLAVELLLICGDAYTAGSFTASLNKVSLLDMSIHLMVIMAAMAILIIVYSNTYMKEKERSEAYARTIEEHYHQQSYYMENLEQLIHKLKSERHDFNNHLGVIYGLLECGETDKARDYAMQLVKTAEEYRNIVDIPHSMVRAMLNYKLSAAKEDGIVLKLNTGVPEELKLNEFDLTVILGNLLDNAMEACAALEEENRYIELSILYKPDYLIIQIENPMKGESVFQDGRKGTTKADAENHGLGLSNIEFLVNKHNGLMKIEAEKGIFRVNIALLVDSQSG